MSLTTDGVWAANVWASTVWADCVWYEPHCVVTEVVRPTGGISKRVKRRKHKTVMIDGETHTINSPEEEFFLLQAFLDKTRNQYEADILKKKTPPVKRNIKLLASKITRTANRISKVEEELKWRRKIRKDDEEILALIVSASPQVDEQLGKLREKIKWWQKLKQDDEEILALLSV